MKNVKKQSNGNVLTVFSGTANRDLTREICDFLGQPPGDAFVRTFSDGEIFVEINQNVRGADVFVVQSTSAPVNANLMELLIMVDAVKRASANRITAVLPYYGYARQDSKVAPRVPISAKLVADLITVAGANRLLTMDLHRGQIQGFFNIPVDHLFAAPVQIKYLRAMGVEDVVIVSPDAGGVERARRFAEKLDTDLAIVDKREDEPGAPEFVSLIGDIKNKVAVILDDMVDTGVTVSQAASVLQEHGASRIICLATHAVFSDGAVERIEASPIERMVVANTIRLSEEAQKSKKIDCFSVAELLGEAIRRINSNDSVSSLFV